MRIDRPFTQALRHGGFRNLSPCFQAYIRICVANERNTGVRLTGDEVAALAELDDAVYSAAQNALEELKRDV